MNPADDKSVFLLHRNWLVNFFTQSASIVGKKKKKKRAANGMQTEKFNSNKKVIHWWQNSLREKKKKSHLIQVLNDVIQPNQAENNIIFNFSTYSDFTGTLKHPKD